MKINDAGRNLIVQFEGLKLEPYLDHIGIPTIGIGTTYYPDGSKVTMNDSAITEERAYELLDFSSAKFCEQVAKFLESIKLTLNENQFSALISFAYNLGAGPVISKGRSLSDALRNKDLAAAAEAILLYNKADGKVSNGLTKRRKAERELFLT